MTGQWVKWQIQRTFYESVTSSLFGSLICSCLCTLVWLCWCRAITGPRVLTLIKFSDKLSKWNVDAVVCLRRGPVQSLETPRNLGLSGTGPPGDSGLALGHCFWGHPPFCVPIQPTICPVQQYSSTQQMNPPMLLKLWLNSEILFYLNRSFGKSSLGARPFRLFSMQIPFYTL